jgi:hypothetical protein
LGVVKRVHQPKELIPGCPTLSVVEIWPVVAEGNWSYCGEIGTMEASPHVCLVDLVDIDDPRDFLQSRRTRWNLLVSVVYQPPLVIERFLVEKSRASCCL